jgi:hypothetical protein
MNMKRAIGLLALIVGMVTAPGPALAVEQNVGKVVAIRGAATIARCSSEIKAQVKAGIQPNDTIKTAAGGRVKLLFIDDSVLTMSENSTLVVKEFIYAKGKEGRSIYNLLDGKMRSVVGKTKFEVRTPTAVAAARGTVIFFEVGQTRDQSYSRIICLEGKVEVKNVSASVRGITLLTPGTMVVVKAGEGPPPPVKAPPAELEKARKATSAGNHTEQGSSVEAGSASPDSTTGQDQQSAPSQQDSSQAGTTAALVETQDSGQSFPAVPAITGTTTSGLGVTPPIKPQPITRQPTRVNIVIGVATTSTH